MAANQYLIEINLYFLACATVFVCVYLRVCATAAAAAAALAAVTAPVFNCAELAA